MIICLKRLKRDEKGCMPFIIKGNVGKADSDLRKAGLAGTVEVKGIIEQDEGLLIVNGEVIATAIIECSRCLNSVRYPLRSGFMQVYSETGEGADVLPIRGDEVDLTVPVKESVLLELPIKVLCKEDCKGICPVCGSDRNIVQCGCRQDIADPRMQKLKELLKE